MEPNDTPLTAMQLLHLTEVALRITGTPVFASADYEGEYECLQFLESDDPDDAVWAFVPEDAEGVAISGAFLACGSPPGIGATGGRAADDVVEEPPGLEERSAGSEDEDGDGADECTMPIDSTLAAELIKSHLRNWLAERGWQVQFELLKGERRWRLADCLSFADGGGDRLDADYPMGEDELSVLCAAVVAVSSAT